LGAAAVLTSFLFFFEKNPNRENGLDSMVGEGRILVELSLSLG
jgi:hypothetical protein